MKTALCILHKKLLDAVIEFGYLGNFHDEFQMETVPEQANNLGEMQAQSIRDAGVFLKLNVPLDGEYKIGSNWADTH